MALFTGHLDVRVDVPPGQTVYVDVYYSLRLNNQVTANQLDWGNIDVVLAGWTNQQPFWNSFVLSTAPNVPLEWVPARAGGSAEGVTVGLIEEDGAYCRFAVASDATLPNDVDSMACVFPTGLAASGDNLLNLRRILTGSGVRAFVRYRQAGQVNLTEAWATTTPGTYSDPLALPNAVHVFAGIEPVHGSAAGTLELRNTGVNLRAVLEPTTAIGVAVGSAVAARYYRQLQIGNLTLDNRVTVEFEELFMDDMTVPGGSTRERMVVDCDAMQAYTEGGTPWYGELKFSDPDRLFYLVPGQNQYSSSGQMYTPGGSVDTTIRSHLELRWRNAYLGV